MVTSPNYRSLKKCFFLIWSGIPPSISNNSIFFTCAIFWRDMGKILWKMGDFGYILISRIISKKWKNDEFHNIAPQIFVMYMVISFIV